MDGLALDPAGGRGDQSDARRGERHRPGGRALFTDPCVVTGQLTNEELRVRSSIGFFLFTPLGHNERLLAEAGFVVREVRDVTEGAASISEVARRSCAEA
jgi:hypothetical protein